MRVFLILLVLALLAWKLMSSPEPVPVEETIIGEPVKRLQEAEQFETQYLEQTDARKQRLEEAVDGDGPRRNP
jgi:hypothetical protein